tara:strand:+ start:363 stop:1313 length:951 start_codon:yes stop_codon:yes gene_type:complete
MPKIKIDESPFDRRKILLNADSNSAGRPGEPYVRNVHSRPEDVALTGGGGSLGTVNDGLMSGANGSLDVHNMGVTDFRIQDIHIMPEQASYARMESFEDTSTLFGNGIGQRNIGDATERWVTLPGISLRWYQPYATTVSLMHWDVFFSFNNWQGEYADKDGRFSSVGRKTKMDFRCVLDGDYVNFSKRRLSENMFHPVSPGYKNIVPTIPGPGLDLYSSYPSDKKVAGKLKCGGPKYIFPEAHSAVPMSLHYPQALSKGFHEIGLQIKTQGISGEAVYVQNIGTEHRSGTVRGRGFFELTAKLSLGIRNARVISFL